MTIIIIRVGGLPILCLCSTGNNRASRLLPLLTWVGVLMLLSHDLIVLYLIIIHCLSFNKKNFKMKEMNWYLKKAINSYVCSLWKGTTDSPVTLQYLTSYTGVGLVEYFMYRGLVPNHKAGEEPQDLKI